MARRAWLVLFWVLVLVLALFAVVLTGSFVDAATHHLQRGQSAGSVWLGVGAGVLIVVALIAAVRLLAYLIHRRYHVGPLGGLKAPASLRDPVHGRRVLFWFLALGVVVAAIASLAGAFNAAIVDLPSGQSRAAVFLAPLVGVVVTVAMFLAARLLARQLRDQYGTGTVERADRGERRRVGSWEARGGQAFVLVLLAGLMVWCALAAFTGVVVGLVPVSHLQAHGSYTTYDLDVLFKHSILGRRQPSPPPSSSPLSPWEIRSLSGWIPASRITPNCPVTPLVPPGTLLSRQCSSRFSLSSRWLASGAWSGTRGPPLPSRRR